MRASILSRLIALMLCFTATVPGYADLVTDGPAELPRIYLDTTFPDTTGYVTKRVCATGCDYKTVQAAVDRIVQDGGNINGEVIRLGTGQTFIGKVTLPAYTMSPEKWIILRPDTADANLPAEGVRMTPAKASFAAKLVQTVEAEPLIQADSGANHYWFMGLDLGVGPAVNLSYVVLAIGNGETNVNDMPRYIYFDRCYIHGNAGGHMKRGLQPDGIAIAAINSYFENFHGYGQEAQAICTWNGPGPFKIVNNYIEGAGENIMFGGARANSPNLIPSDIEMRFNHFYKPPSWFQYHPSFVPPAGGGVWTVKNLLEFKNAQRVLIHGNVFENNWGQAQTGFAILMTPRSENGTMPWATVSDITYRYNVLMHSGAGINMSGRDGYGPSKPTHQVSIHDNLFQDIDGTKWNGDNRLFQLLNSGSVPDNPHDISMTNNTAFQAGAIMMMGDSRFVRMPGIVFSNNLLPHNQSGFGGSGSGGGNQAISDYLSGAVFTNNVMQTPDAGIQQYYPPNNFFPLSWAAVEFEDFAGNDFRLKASSPYKNAGSDGKDIGADVSGLIRETCYAVTGTPAASCTELPSPLPPPSSPPATPITSGFDVALTPVVSPNPWRADRHSSSAITFAQLPANATVKIFTVSGHLLKTLKGSTSVVWDLTASGGQKAASGVYLYIVEGEGRRARGKLAIIR